MKVLIVGGGIAGMALAALLKKQGIDPLIVDTAPEYRHIGFGLYLWHNGRTVLDEIGIGHHLIGKEYMAPGLSMKDREYQLIHYLPFDYFGPYRPISIQRADLHEGLREAVKDVRVRFNTTVAAIRQDNDGVDVTFSDNTADRFDLVVGADGIHSTVRDQVLGPTKLWPYGWSTWVFWADTWKFATEEAQYIFTPGQVIAALPLRGRHFVMLGATCTPGVIDSPGTRRERLHAHASNFDASVHDLIDDIKDERDIYRSDFMYVPMGPWARGRVVLLGDARHGLSPVGGMGANMALEDASVLANELLSTPDVKLIPDTLRRFGERRTARVNTVRRAMRVMDHLTLVKSRPGIAVRNTTLGFLSLFRFYMKPMRRVLRSTF